MVQVRHESAEALGAIEGTDEEWAHCEATLRAYLQVSTALSDHHSNEVQL
jgi:hypothetical protein